MIFSKTASIFLMLLASAAATAEAPASNRIGNMRHSTPSLVANKKNRVMAEDKKSSNLNNEELPNTSYLGTIAEIGRTEGLSGLLAGAVPRVGKALLSGAIQFATYEETKKDLANLFAKQKVG